MIDRKLHSRVRLALPLCRLYSTPYSPYNLISLHRHATKIRVAEPSWILASAPNLILIDLRRRNQLYKNIENLCQRLFVFVVVFFYLQRWFSRVFYFCKSKNLIKNVLVIIYPPFLVCDKQYANLIIYPFTCLMLLYRKTVI